MQKQRLENYVVLPRQIVSDWRNGLISKPERNLYTWLRQNGNPYGVAVVDLELLSKEAFNNEVGKSYINKLMLSLKSKRYIWYEERAGRRGSFEVRMGDWILPTKSISTLNRYFESSSDGGLVATDTIEQEEPDHEVNTFSQSFDTEESIADVDFISPEEVSSIRGTDNDNDTYNEKDNDRHSLATKDIKVEDFEVHSHEDDQMKRIADCVGETSMGFILGIHKRHGAIGLNAMMIEAANLADYKDVRNKPALFNSNVCRRLNLY